MKKLISLIFFGLIFLFACVKDDFQDLFESPSKLLVSIKKISSESIRETTFKYDSLKRLSQVEIAGSNLHYDKILFYYNFQNRLEKTILGEFTTDYEYYNNGKLTAQIVHFKSLSDGYEWVQRTEYEYSRGRISKAIGFSGEGKELSHTSYKYDSRGNTIETTTRSATGDSDGMIHSQVKYEYDDKVNPCLCSGLSLGNFGISSSIKQGNNPTYSYSYSSVMSTFPPENQINYEYDDEGLPVKGTIIDIGKRGYTDTITLEYEYLDVVN